MINQSIKSQVEDKVLEVLMKAQELYNRTFEIPNLRYRQMGRKAGLAHYSNWTVELNSDFFHNGHLDSMINDILPHELAHLISYVVYGRVMGRGHGRCWKSVMICLGLKPDRCHNYSLEGVKTRKKAKNPVKCPTCGTVFEITDRRVQQIQAGHKIWHATPLCRRMKACLELVGDSSLVSVA